MLKYFFILFIFCISLQSYAQTIGCAVGSINYTTVQSGTTYSKNGTKVNLGAGCAWYYTSPSTCSVNGGIGSGLKAYSTPQSCPIDDYIGLMLIAFAGLGYFFIKKKSLVQFKVN